MRLRLATECPNEETLAEKRWSIVVRRQNIAETLRHDPREREKGDRVK